MTPLFIGRTAWKPGGVRPRYSRAASPTAMPLSSTSLVPLRTATTDGSSSTMPRSRTNTSVLAVPRSMPTSTENRLSIHSNALNMTPPGCVPPTQRTRVTCTKQTVA